MVKLVEHLVQQQHFSLRAFGPGTRQKGVTDHLRKELVEIVEGDNDPAEWVDVWLLSMDGAWRSIRGQGPDLTETEIAVLIHEGHMMRQGQAMTATPSTILSLVEAQIGNIADDPNNEPGKWLMLSVYATLGLVYALMEKDAELSPQQAANLSMDMILAKQAKNEARDWPDWRTADPDKAIEHVKGKED